MGNEGRRIVHLTSVHDHRDHRILAKECRTLAEAGYSVTLIAPNDVDTVIDGIRVRAIPPPRNRVERITRTMRLVYRAALEEDADLYHFHDPELILVGLLLKLRGKRVVYDVHEDMVRTILRKGWIPPRLRFMRPALAWAVGVVEGIAIQLLDAAVIVIPMRDRAFSRSKSVLVRNFPRIERFSSSGRPYHERPPLVAYVGGVSLIRGARDMVTAMALLPDDLDARLAIAGSFQPPSLGRDLHALSGSERVDLLGEQTWDAIATLLGEARIGLCMLHPVPGYPESYPVKLFEYMAAGIPVIASDFPAWREVVEGAGCGIVIEPQRPAALAEAIASLLRNPELGAVMGQRGRQAAIDRYHWGPEGQRLLMLYNRLLTRGRAESAIS